MWGSKMDGDGGAGPNNLLPSIESAVILKDDKSKYFCQI
jgi:hypothetical protein